jgi:hypothetical protein
MVDGYYTGRTFLGECGGNVYGDLKLNKNSTIKNIPAPIENGDAVNKEYVDDATDIPLAGSAAEPVSLVGITTSDTSAITISDTQIQCGLSNTTTINIQGNVEFEFSDPGSIVSSIIVDGNTLYSFDYNSMTSNGVTSYNGNITSSIVINFISGGGLTFTKFNRIEYVDGLMPGEMYSKIATLINALESYGISIEELIATRRVLVGGEW